MTNNNSLTSIELCAGAGGQALGLEMAGFDHIALIDDDKWCVETLHVNRPEWNVILEDLRDFDATSYAGVDLVAGGVPCPPFSVAGKQLGADDERDLFPTALRIIRETQPKAVLLENVRGLLDRRFDRYRHEIIDELNTMGFAFAEWRLVQARDHGVPQLRPRSLLVALKAPYADRFEWPEPRPQDAPTVGQALRNLIGARGWVGADDWARKANDIGPTLVGGSKKHGGPDLGPTRAREAWLKLGVDGRGVANEAPAPDFEGLPRLTVAMAAKIQGFPDSWAFSGKKTNSYRQVGNAFPPPVARRIGWAIANALTEVDETYEETRVEGEAEAVLLGEYR